MKISVQELLIVLAIVLIIFGPTQIPKLVKSIRKSSKAMTEAMQDDDDDEEEIPAAKKAKKSSKKNVKKAAAEEDTSDDDE